MENQINLNPGRPALNARELDALLTLYLEDAALRLGASTVHAYASSLAIFRRWWQSYGPRHQWQLERRDLERFAAHLESTSNLHHGQPLTHNTRQMVLARLRQALRWAAHNDYVLRDYSVWVPKATGSAPERHIAPVSALPRLMLAASQSRNPERDSAILAVLIGTGMRRAECVALDVEDVSFTLTGGGQIDIRRGKGGKPRTVIFGDTTGMYLGVHLAALDAERGPLWHNRFGTRLLTGAFYRAIRQCVERAGLDDLIRGPHDFRRLFATTWNRKRRSLAAAAPLSKQLGHTTPAMTLQYILPTLEDIEAEYREPFDFMYGDED